MTGMRIILQVPSSRCTKIPKYGRVASRETRNATNRGAYPPRRQRYGRENDDGSSRRLRSARTRVSLLDDMQLDRKSYINASHKVLNKTKVQRMHIGEIEPVLSQQRWMGKAVGTWSTCGDLDRSFELGPKPRRATYESRRRASQTSRFMSSGIGGADWLEGQGLGASQMEDVDFVRPVKW